MIALAQPGLLELLGVSYLGAGAALAWRLRGEASWPALVGTVLAWPVFLPLLGAEPEPVGPYTARIRSTFAALQSTLRDPAAGDVSWNADLDPLRSALLRTDERLALVDRLLAESPTPALALALARSRAGSEVEAVLDEVLQLRLQIGLAALAGDAASVRGRLADLLARARALDEVERNG